VGMSLVGQRQVQDESRKPTSITAPIQETLAAYLDIVVPFEPLTPRSGGGALLRRRRSLPTLLERESQGEDLESLRRAPGRAGLVSITVVFL
jgi:hypothetical protein